MTDTTPQGQVPEAIAGALFDFAGFLTTLPKERAVTLSGAHLATPVVDLLTEWAKTRGLNLDEANVKGWVAALTAALASAPAQPAEVENLRKALQFYANGEHFMKADEHAWDTVSGEPQNYWCDEAGTATVEDGSIAGLALAGHPIQFEGAAAPAQPVAEPGAAYAALPECSAFLLCKGSDVTARAWNVDQMRAFADATYALRIKSRATEKAEHDARHRLAMTMAGGGA